MQSPKCTGEEVDRVSQRDRLLQDVTAKTVAHTTLTDYIDLHSEELLEVHDQPTVIEQGSVLVETDDQVQIGGFGSVSTGNRAEDTQLMRAVPAGDGKNSVTILNDLVLGQHGTILSDFANNFDGPSV
jgi:hypothetical protein